MADLRTQRPAGPSAGHRPHHERGSRPRAVALARCCGRRCALLRRAGAGWDERTSAGSVEHLAALAAAPPMSRRSPSGSSTWAPAPVTAALFLAREFPRASVRGVDMSEEMIRAAQAKVGLDPEGRIAFRVADAAALPYGEESFDLVTQVNVPPFFAEIARVLRPGGHVIVAASSGDPGRPSTPPPCSNAGCAAAGSSRSKAARRAGTYVRRACRALSRLGRRWRPASTPAARQPVRRRRAGARGCCPEIERELRGPGSSSDRVSPRASITASRGASRPPRPGRPRSSSAATA